MEDRVVSLEHIRKEYRSTVRGTRNTAVEDLSLKVEKGEIFGLLGPNGAGKTTTLKVLLGLVFPDGGSGHVLGAPLGDGAARGRLGFLPEQPYFYGFLTAEKGLDLYGKFFALSGGERKKRADRLIDLVGLPRGSQLTLDKYSKGMLQRFGIAQALINDPELVIMDEPSSGLDPVGQKEVRDLLLRLKDEGKTVFLSSHQLSEVENICDSVCIINRGRSVRGGALEELLAAEGFRRIILRGADEAAREALGRLSLDSGLQDERLTLKVESGDTYSVLAAARDLGLDLEAVEPCRKSLEELFMETVGEGGD